MYFYTINSTTPTPQSTQSMQVKLIPVDRTLQAALWNKRQQQNKLI